MKTGMKTAGWISTIVYTIGGAFIGYLAAYSYAPDTLLVPVLVGLGGFAMYKLARWLDR